MNANELADKLEQGHWEGGTREQAATMLRQQQDELDALKERSQFLECFYRTVKAGAK